MPELNTYILKIYFAFQNILYKPGSKLLFILSLVEHF